MQLVQNPAFIPRPGSYNGLYTESGYKVRDVIGYLNDQGAVLKDLVYISIGGANGADVLKILRETDIDTAILMEYDPRFCEMARTAALGLPEGKTLHVVEGDAFSNRGKVNELLMNQHKKGSMDLKGVVLTGFSVFHELSYRCPYGDYDLRNLIVSLVEGIPEVYFYSREVCKFQEWVGRVVVSFPEWLTTGDLHRFSLIVQRMLAYRNTSAFNDKVIQTKDGVEMNAALATEVVKKLVYFLHDHSVGNLLYELQESHANFFSESFTDVIRQIFLSTDKNTESGMWSRNDGSEAFRSLYLRSKVRIRSIGHHFDDSLVPSGFIVLTAYFRPRKKKAAGQ